MKVVVAHEWLTTLGGSEKVTREILSLFPEAHVITSVARPETVRAIVPATATLETLFVDRLPGARKRWQPYLPAMMVAWSRARADGADLLISSSHACTKAIGLHSTAPHISYCHTPMRYAWRPDLETHRLPRPLRIPMLGGAAALRRWDASTSRRVDAFVANSHHVASRIKDAYGRGATVVHPPVEVDRFLSQRRDPAGFYLIAGRVVAYKKIDIAIRAFNRSGLALVIAGAGPDVPRLKKLAGSNIAFAGSVSDAELADLYSKAEALVFPGEDDFGITPVEAQASGCPVIAYGAGGSKETVREGETGVLFEHQDVASLAAAIDRAQQIRFDQALLRSWAEGFGPQRFREGFMQVVEETLARRG